MEKYLNEMKPTEKGIVKKITTDGKIKRRLYDMGVTPGAQIIVKKYAIISVYTLYNITKEVEEQ